MSPLILPPNYQRSTATTRERYRYWHDLRYPGDVARNIVVAQREGRKGPRMPEKCPDINCRACHTDNEREGR